MTYCLTLHLKDDPELIRAYEAHHKAVWPEVIRSIREAGIVRMEIYRYGARLCMILETTEDFDFARKAESDAQNPVVQEWEALMWTYQQALPGTIEGEKWKLMDKIFELNDY